MSVVIAFSLLLFTILQLYCMTKTSTWFSLLEVTRAYNHPKQLAGTIINKHQKQWLINNLSEHIGGLEIHLRIMFPFLFNWVHKLFIQRYESINFPILYFSILLHFYYTIYINPYIKFLI
jgi:hypothetical protein